MFIPNKHLVRHMDHQSGVLIQLYDYDSDLLNSPNVPNSIKVEINDINGYISSFKTSLHGLSNISYSACSLILMGL